jgi:dTMP kinase
VPLEVIREIDGLATGGRVPDHTLLFDLPAEEALRRGQSSTRRSVDRLDAESLAFYARVMSGYHELAAAEPGRFTVIDSSGPAERAARRVRESLGALLGVPA